jgi:hypothetical protein
MESRMRQKERNECSAPEKKEIVGYSLFKRNEEVEEKECLDERN